MAWHAVSWDWTSKKAHKKHLHNIISQVGFEWELSIRNWKWQEDSIRWVRCSKCKQFSYQTRNWRRKPVFERHRWKIKSLGVSRVAGTSRYAAITWTHTQRTKSIYQRAATAGDGHNSGKSTEKVNTKLTTAHDAYTIAVVSKLHGLYAWSSTSSPIDL